MNILNFNRKAIALALSVAVLGVAAPQGKLAQAFPPTSGIACTTSPTNTFALTAQAGYISTPDGNTIYVWSYRNSAGDFQFPGPVLCVNQGDLVTVTLSNSLNEPVSITFPGQQNVYADGAPAMPVFSGPNLTSLTNVAAPSGSTTYTFTVSEPGTYLYQSGTDVAKQVQMGLYGALVVRPAGHADWAYNRADTQFNPANEYVMLLSEMDPALHVSIENNTPYDFTTLHNRYWMVNGRSFPDTIAPNNAAWIPSQPYSSLVHMHPKAASGPDALPAMVRYLSVGTKNHPFHPHGNHGRIIARDGRVLQGAANQDMAYEKFLVMIGAGQTWDATYEWTNVENWNPATNPVPITLTQQLNQTYGEYYAGSPYLGVQDELPSGLTSYNECGEYYHMWHSHALNESANYDAAFGGMLTLQRIDPPTPNACP